MNCVDNLPVENPDLNEYSEVVHAGVCRDATAPFTPRILVAEDNPVNQEVAKLMLEMLGCSVTQAESGIQAVQMATEESYDLILMDCQMPEMDGLEASRLIRKMEDARDKAGRRPITIIAMTGNSSDEDRDRCLANGMDDFLRKPFAIDDIQEVLGRWLPVGRLEGNSAGSEQNRFAEGSPIDIKYHDNILALEKEGATGILAKVIDHYLSDSPAAIQSLKEAVEAENGEVIRSIAHRFKSGSANLGALRLAEICQEMELSAGTNTLIMNRDALSRMENEYEAVKTALAAVKRGDKI